MNTGSGLLWSFPARSGVFMAWSKIVWKRARTPKGENDLNENLVRNIPLDPCYGLMCLSCRKYHWSQGHKKLNPRVNFLDRPLVSQLLCPLLIRRSTLAWRWVSFKSMVLDPQLESSLPGRIRNSRSFCKLLSASEYM